MITQLNQHLGNSFVVLDVSYCKVFILHYPLVHKRVLVGVINPTGPCVTSSTWWHVEPGAWSGCWGRRNSCHTLSNGTSSLRCERSDGPSGWLRWRTAFRSGGRGTASPLCGPSGGAWGCRTGQSSSRIGCTGTASPQCGCAHGCVADTGGRSGVNKRCRRKEDRSAAAAEAVLIPSPASDCWKLGKVGSD